LIDPSDLNSPEIKIDRANAFLLYATFCGDVVRTGAALGVPATQVLRMADEENWNDQLRAILELKKSARPGDIERAINRALNFVQAHRLRMFLERVIQRVTGMNADEFETYLLSSTTSKGETVPKLSTRALADLASALEKAQALTYMALNDTAQERVRRKEEDSTGNSTEMHLQIAEAMKSVRTSNTPRAALFDAQLSVAQEIVASATVPVSPLDNDNH
jgi:hypothetical protein